MAADPLARVLLAVDHPSHVSKELRRLGYEAKEASSLSLAIQAVELESFDVVLTDVEKLSADLGGFIRRAENVAPDLAVIAMVAPEKVGNALELGAADFVLRPFDADAADLVFRRALEIRNLRQQNAQLVEALEIAQREAASSEEELRFFNSTMSHDLKAPLNRIAGFSSMLRETQAQSLDLDGQECLEFIESSIKEMKLLIDGLFNIAQTRTAEPKFETIDLTMLAHTEAYGLYIRQPGRKVTFEIEEGLSAFADERLLTLALKNLFSNALKFSQNVPEAVIALGRYQGCSGDTFFVRDNGIGFNPDLSNNLFKPFKRLHSEPEFAGSGVGLCTVARIMKRLGGSVWAESTPGQGATFFFSLPDRPVHSAPFEATIYQGNFF